MSDPPAPEGSGWKARRHRRRDRQRAALQAEASTHDPSDVAHFEKTARRYFREAIRERLRSDMHMPWDDDGAHGLRVVIDLGMQELMCDAERRSLVTQLQLSYADPLRLAVDAVEKAWEEEYRDTQDTRVSSEPLSYYSSQRDRAREKADAALRRFQRSPATRLLFSSLSGTFESILSNDAGSKRWAVRRSARRFDEAVDELFSVARGRGPTGDLPLEESRTKTSSLLRAEESPSARRKPKSRDSIVVLSPDASETFPLNEPLDVSAIYVVGGLCDYKRVRGATLRRADDADVVARRLPIEDAFGTNASVNILTVNQTVQILSRVARNEGDWRLALIETLPERKLREMRARMEDVAKRRGTGDDDDSSREDELHAECSALRDALKLSKLALKEADEAKKSAVAETETLRRSLVEEPKEPRRVALREVNGVVDDSAKRDSVMRKLVEKLRCDLKQSEESVAKTIEALAVETSARKDAEARAERLASSRAKEKENAEPRTCSLLPW